MRIARSQAFSFGLHVLVALLLLAAARSIRAPRQRTPPWHATPLTFVRPHLSSGSNQSALPARHGSPPPTALRTFIPPASNNHPELALPITIAFDIPTDSTSANIGDPLSHLTEGAFGMHGHNGIGDAPSETPGIGSVQRGRGVTPPQLVYKVEPEFSEEARKAKHQGRVVLTIEVDASGNVRNVRIRQSLGLGLDEKAMDAVSHWRFRPGVVDGKPVITEAVVEVNFQLL
jgi:periplasmic protein TonB